MNGYSVETKGLHICICLLFMNNVSIFIIKVWMNFQVNKFSVALRNEIIYFNSDSINHEMFRSIEILINISLHINIYI